MKKDYGRFIITVRQEKGLFVSRIRRKLNNAMTAVISEATFELALEEATKFADILEKRVLQQVELANA